MRGVGVGALDLDGVGVPSGAGVVEGTGVSSPVPVTAGVAGSEDFVGVIGSFAGMSKSSSESANRTSSTYFFRLLWRPDLRFWKRNIESGYIAS
jgi:hypothetical protein